MIVIGLFIVLTYVVKYYFTPFFFVLIITFFSSPVYDFIERSKIINRYVNGFLSLLIVNLLFFLFIGFFINFVYAGISTFVYEDYSSVSKNVDSVIKNLSFNMHIDFADLTIKAKTYAMSLVNGDLLKRSAIYTTEGLFAYFIANMVAYFILVDKYVIVNLFEILIDHNKVTRIFNKIQDIKGIFKIELILVCITTILTTIGLYILNIKNAFLIGICCGTLDLLPFVGAALVFIPLIVYKILSGQYILAIGLISLYLVLLIFRQIMETKFMSRRLNLHPIFVILSMYIGIKAFGFIGLFMALLCAITAKEVIISK